MSALAEHRWCILRTSPGRTLPLARSLAAAGFDVWTPTEVITRPKTRRRPAEERPAPIMPTFVFARASHIGMLASILSLPINPHPAFSIFRYGGGIPIIADRDIARLRQAEERASLRALKGKRHTFRIGQRVEVPKGSFAGLSGVVEDCNGKTALVCFGGSFEVRIATYLLSVDDDGTHAVHDAPSRKGAAA